MVGIPGVEWGWWVATALAGATVSEAPRSCAARPENGTVHRTTREIAPVWGARGANYTRPISTRDALVNGVGLARGRHGSAENGGGVRCGVSPCRRAVPGVSTAARGFSAKLLEILEATFRDRRRHLSEFSHLGCLQLNDHTLPNCAKSAINGDAALSH